MKQRRTSQPKNSTSSKTASLEDLSKQKGLAKKTKFFKEFALVFVGVSAFFLFRHAMFHQASEQTRLLFLLVQLVALSVFLVTCASPIPQDQAYHMFADNRCTSCKIPNTNDVLSNLVFLASGTAGVIAMSNGSARFLTAIEEQAWMTFFVGMATVCFGSAYYHWRPDDARLVWDRLPMTVCFMSLFTLLVQERSELARSVGPSMLVFCIVVGVYSIIHWVYFKDLRVYLVVQFFPLFATPELSILFPSPTYSHGEMVHWCLMGYVAAKVVEILDRQIYEFTGKVVSGHTLKHLFAGFSIFFLVYMVSARSVIAQ
jgi:hypothetical protein